MNEPTQPVAASTDIPARQPLVIDAAVMWAHHAAGRAIPLSAQARHHMFIRYDNTWWIAHHNQFVEITSPDQQSKLDRWHRRVTQGALWE